MLYDGINNGIKQTAKQPAAWIPLLSSIHPAALIIGIAGLTAYALFNGAKSAKKPEKQPLPNGSIAAKLTVEPLILPLISQPLTVEPAVESYKKSSLSTVVPYKKEAVPAVAPLKDEAFKQEAIRQHMSALGKKSAAARAKKREEAYFQVS